MNRHENLTRRPAGTPFFQPHGRFRPDISYLCGMDFFERIRNDYGLSAGAVRTLAAAAERIDAGRKTCLVREGERDAWLYFVEEGSLRTYVMREDRCVILNFAFEGDPATSVLGVAPSGLAFATVETLEPSRLVRIPRMRMDELFRSSAELADWGRRMSERMLRSHEEYFADYSWREKGKQYFRLLAEYPELLLRVARKDLAAYLFVTPQTLSRIRAAVKRKLP